MNLVSRRMCATPFRVLHQVNNSPQKIARQRLDRVQKIKKITKSLFGPVDKNEFKNFAKIEIEKIQTQASHRWGFDFILDKPISTSNEYQWEPMRLTDIPKTYQPAISIPSKTPSRCSNESTYERAPTLQSIIIHEQRFIQTKKVASSCQTKITDFLKVRKRSISYNAPPIKKVKLN